jgi:hypothetical protein
MASLLLIHVPSFLFVFPGCRLVFCIDLIPGLFSFYFLFYHLNWHSDRSRRQYSIPSRLEVIRTNSLGVGRKRRKPRRSGCMKKSQLWAYLGLYSITGPTRLQILLQAAPRLPRVAWQLKEVIRIVYLFPDLFYLSLSNCIQLNFYIYIQLGKFP